MDNAKGPRIDPRRIPGVLDRGARFAQAEHAENAGAAIRRLAVYFGSERAILAGLLTVVVCGTLLGVSAPGLQSRAVDILAGAAFGSFSRAVLLMLGAYLLYSGCQLLQGLFSAYLSQRVVRRMRNDLFAKMMELPVRYMDEHSHGDVMSRMTNDIENVSSTVSQSLPSLCSGVLTLLGTAAVMFWYCWQLALLSCVTILLTMLATRLLSGQVRRYSRRRQELLGQLNGTAEEMISGYRTVVACRHEQATAEAFRRTSDELTKAGIRTDVFSGVMGPVMNCIGNVGFVVIAVFGGYFSVRGLISVGVISAFIVYAKQFSRPVNELAQIYGQLQTAVAGAERVFAVLDVPSEETAGEPLALAENTEIRFEKVGFGYLPDRPVIHDFSLTVPAGKKVALVGATGSGKTTLTNLLLRFYEPQQGAVLINGQDIRALSLAGLRQSTAVVLQDTVLFSDTVRANLTYGRPNAPDEHIWRALRLSRCEELVCALPQGLDTVLENGGEAISQGQRQLLAIARALIADPRILILDEATSNVDTRTEKAIQDAMQRAMERRTCIIIAHRLSTIRDADLIVVMDGGKIAEQGDHVTLLAQKGKYYELYMTQFTGFAT